MNPTNQNQNIQNIIDLFDECALLERNNIINGEKIARSEPYVKRINNIYKKIKDESTIKKLTTFFNTIDDVISSDKNNEAILYNIMEVYKKLKTPTKNIDKEIDTFCKKIITKRYKYIGCFYDYNLKIYMAVKPHNKVPRGTGSSLEEHDNKYYIMDETGNITQEIGFNHGEECWTNDNSIDEKIRTKITELLDKINK
jgi:hypothetical protein